MEEHIEYLSLRDLVFYDGFGFLQKTSGLTNFCYLLHRVVRSLRLDLPMETQRIQFQYK